MTAPHLATAELVLGNPRDEAAAAERLAAGGVVGYGFGNVYALVTRPEADAVRRANLLKGRPVDQVGSIVTTPARLSAAFDWSRLPAGLTRHAVLGLLDAFFEAGPFGFRGPAAAGLPAHLVQPAGGVPTTQVIAPGYACPSNAFVGACLHRVGGDFLYITSANRSHRLSGAVEEPAHYRGDALEAEFPGGADVLLLRHRDEGQARARFPAHAPMSTTILALHRTAGFDAQGRVRLVVERHGSLPVEEARRIAAPLGVDLVLGTRAGTRLSQRSYSA